MQKESFIEGNDKTPFHLLIEYPTIAASKVVLWHCDMLPTRQGKRNQEVESF